MRPYNSRRLRQAGPERPTEKNDSELPIIEFSQQERTQLEHVIDELKKIQAFMRKEILPFSEELQAAQALKNKDEAEWQKIFNDQWRGAMSNFGKLPDTFLEKLKKIELKSDYVATPNVAELIRNLSLPPHVARVYGSQTGQMYADVSNAIIYLQTYLK